MKILLYGFITGIVFGYLLQRARVLRFDKQIGALRLVDMTIIKFMMTAGLVGMVGIYFCDGFGWIAFDVKALQVGANIVGGLLFGAGWAVLGYCPGTAGGALGEGRWDALWGIAGMVVGGAVFAEIFPLVKSSLTTLGDYGKVTLPQLAGVSPWVVIVLFAAVSFVLFRFLEKKGL